MLTLNALLAACVARQAEWDPKSQLPLSFRGLEFAGEAGELCNVLKKLERERLGIKGSRATVDDLKEELADSIISAVLIAYHTAKLLELPDFDIDDAIARKFNKTSEANALQTMLPVKTHITEQGLKLFNKERRAAGKPAVTELPHAIMAEYEQRARDDLQRAAGIPRTAEG